MNIYSWSKDYQFLFDLLNQYPVKVVCRERGPFHRLFSAYKQKLYDQYEVNVNLAAQLNPDGSVNYEKTKEMFIYWCNKQQLEFLPPTSKEWLEDHIQQKYQEADRELYPEDYEEHQEEEEMEIGWIYPDPRDESTWPEKRVLVYEDWGLADSPKPKLEIYKCWKTALRQNEYLKNVIICWRPAPEFPGYKEGGEK